MNMLIHRRSSLDTAPICPTRFTPAFACGRRLNAEPASQDNVLVECTSKLAFNTLLQLFHFSDSARALARSAALLAVRSRAEFRLLHVLEPTRVAGEPWTVCGMALDSERAQVREKRLQAFIIEEMPPGVQNRLTDWIQTHERVSGTFDTIVRFDLNEGTGTMSVVLALLAVPPCCAN